MRLGGPVFEKYKDPDSWALAVKRLGYDAAYCPVEFCASDEDIKGYRDAAKAANIVIAEVGIWNNPLCRDESQRKEALERCKKGLEVASKIGAKCCVNISGSRGTKWDGPDVANLTNETFDMIVQIVRQIIDDVKPVNTFYSLETMPWMYPDSPDTYLELIHAIDRAAFAVHFDPVNMICSPQRYFNNGSFIKECFAKVGEYIKSCHAKDIILHDRLTVCLEEIRPGKGFLDYPVYLKELGKLNIDIPLMLEHLQDASDYQHAAAHIHSIAQQEGLVL